MIITSNIEGRAQDMHFTKYAYLGIYIINLCMLYLVTALNSHFFEQDTVMCLVTGVHV